MTTKAMPPPWTHRQDVRHCDNEDPSKVWNAREIWSPGYGVVCYVPLRHHDDGESEANSRLIERAASLHALCQELDSHLDGENVPKPGKLTTATSRNFQFTGGTCTDQRRAGTAPSLEREHEGKARRPAGR